MSERSYGVAEQTVSDSPLALMIEEVTLKGYTIVPDAIPSDELPRWRDRIDRIYAQQEAQFGRTALEAISELDVCRAPLLYDLDFLELATLPKTRDIVRAFLGDWHQLNLQNAIINRPATVHHQSAWHRDLPYQNLVTSHPLGINVLFAIDDFSAETGGTNLLPYSHKTVTLPSSEFVVRNHIVATAKAGSAIVFDVMLFHKAGANRSSIIRRAVNQLFTSPIIKQQYDFSTALLSQQEKLTDDQKRLLGFSSRVALDDKTWREERARRLKPGGM